MRCIAVVLTLAACGRVGFEPVESSEALSDGSMATANIARVQVVNPPYDRVRAISLPIDVTAGNVLVAFAYWNRAAASMAVTDTLGLAWSSRPPQQGPTSCGDNLGLGMQMFYASVATTGSTTVTATQSTGTDGIGLFVVEYAGLDAVSPVEMTTGMTAQSSSNLMTTGPITMNDGVILAAFQDSEGSGVMTPGGGLTVLSRDTNAYTLFGELRGPAGTYEPTANLPAGVNNNCWVAIAAALRAR